MLSIRSPTELSLSHQMAKSSALNLSNQNSILKKREVKNQVLFFEKRGIRGGNYVIIADPGRLADSESR